MFGIPTLYLKLGASLALVLAVAGGYFYVKGLQNKVKTLTTENIVATEANKTLTESVAETQRMQEVRDKVSEAHTIIREQNVIVRNKREEVINNTVQKGEDKPVGPVLRDFFNAE